MVFSREEAVKIKRFYILGVYCVFLKIHVEFLLYPDLTNSFKCERIRVVNLTSFEPDLSIHMLIILYEYVADCLFKITGIGSNYKQSENISLTSHCIETTWRFRTFNVIHIRIRRIKASLEHNTIFNMKNSTKIIDTQRTISHRCFLTIEIKLI